MLQVAAVQLMQAAGNAAAARGDVRTAATSLRVDP